MTPGTVPTPDPPVRTRQFSLKGGLRVRPDWGIAFVLGSLGFLTFVPIIMLLQLSFKSEQQMADAMWLPTLPLRTINYLKAFNLMGPYIRNSMVFVLGTVTISIACSVLAAFVMARYAFPGREFFYMAVLALMMIPGVLTLYTRFVTTVDLKLNNTNWGVWLPLAAISQPLQIVILRTFFASIPEELFEAARLDGAGEISMLHQIALPLAKPILTTLIVLQINGVWNEFIWPMMVLSQPERWPAILGVWRLRSQFTRSDLGAQYAGFVLACLPLLVLFSLSSRAFVRGLTSGAIKM